MQGKRYTRKSMCLMLTFLMLSTVFPFALISAGSSPNVVFAAPAPLTLKWSVNPGNSDTLFAPLAAKLVPGSTGLQIVLTGGNTSSQEDATTSDGDVVCLNGTNGKLIWRASGYSMGVHNPFQIVDLNNDGNLEIVIADWNQTIALNGKNGSLYWKSPAGSDDLIPAIADVNGDGYLEIFVAHGDGPYAGSDWISELDHNGNILRQAYTWHPCFGGLTIGDPNGDGKLELLQGDRSPTYGGSTDRYKGGGMGIRAFDAATLTPLWDYLAGFCSSHAPILADVLGDGKLDVIAGNQNTNGIDVLNATDGTVLGGFRTGGTNMPVHSEPTVGDFNGDGHLELMDCTYSQVKIWDLYSWQSEGGLVDELGNPLMCAEPPKVGNVTGGPYPDIIASADSDPTNPYANQHYAVYIYEWNPVLQTYAIVQKLTGLYDNARNFSLVADVDGDGYNELILTSSGGTVYCYGTSVPVNPAIRTNIQFYSECNRGVAEPVPPPIPSGPVLRDEQPLQGSLNQTSNPTLSINALEYQQNPLSIVFSTNASGIWKNIGSYPNVPGGIYSVTTLNMNQLGTSYYWSVSATDGINPPVLSNYTFTTYSTQPTQGTPLLVSSGNTNTTSEDLICSNVSTVDNNQVTNIYSFYNNGAPFANLQLSFDTRTTSNPFVSDQFFSDGFENGFSNWKNNGVTNWVTSTSQKHSGAYSAQATGGDTYLISNNLGTASAEGMTLSFWYRTHGVSSSIYLQFWDGSTYRTIFDLGSTRPEDTWQYYSAQTYDPRYLNATFRVRFDASSIKTGQDVWIDDFSITVPTRTMDYSGQGNHGTIHGVTWTPQGVQGGAYNFNGINNFIRVPDNPTLGGDGTWSQITVEFWVKLAQPSTGTCIIGKKAGPSSTGSYMVGLEASGSPPDTLYFGLNSTSDNTWHDLHDNSLTVLSVGVWHHVVCTYQSGVGMAIYIDGTERTSTPLTGNIGLGPYPRSANPSVFKQPLFIGSDGSWSPSTWLNGSLDEVRIYPVALTSSQISQRYSETEGGLSNNSTISSSQISAGDVWRCQVTPNDGFGDGTPKFSNNLTVLNSSSSQYGLVVGFVGSGTTNATGTTMYNAGTVVYVSAAPASGWTLSNWLLNGSYVAPTNPYPVTMNQNYNLTANFTLPVQYGLVVGFVGSGTTNATGTTMYNAGTVVYVSAAPASGWTLSNWLLNGSYVAPTNPYPVTMNQNYNLTANFTLTPNQPLFNSSFEVGSFSDWSGVSTVGGGTASVTSALAHDGSYSAVFGTGGGGSVARAYCYENLGGEPTVYALAYVYVNSSVSLSAGNALWVIQFRDSGGSVLASYGFKNNGGSVNWACMYGGQNVFSSSGPQSGVWYAVEAFFTKASSGKTLTIFVNGQEAASLSVDTSGANSVARVCVGIGYNDPGYTFSIYVDTVTISRQYVSTVTWTINLGSSQDVSTTTNLGTISVAGNSYTLPNTVPETSGVYTIQYTPGLGYNFVQWQTTGSVLVSNPSAISTTVTLSGNGVLTAIYNLTGSTGPLFNSSFEVGSFSDWSGVSTVGGGTASVTSALAHDGSYSAVFGTGGGGSVARAYCYENLGGEPTVYALAYVYVNSSVSLSAGNALWVIQFRDSGGSVLASYGFKNNGGSVNWACMYGGQNAFSSSGPQSGVWYAVEAFFTKASSGKTLTIFVNGQEAASLSVDTSGANSVARVCVGIGYNDPGYTFSIYVDTVTIDRKYI